MRFLSIQEASAVSGGTTTAQPPQPQPPAVYGGDDFASVRNSNQSIDYSGNNSSNGGNPYHWEIEDLIQ